MKQILIKVLLTLGILLIIDRSYYFIVYNQLFTKTISGETGGNVNFVTKHKRNVDFLVLGTSRAKRHVNPDLLKDCYNANGYNLAVQGVGGLIYNHILLDILLENQIKPKLIIFQVDPYLFLEKHNPGNQEIQPLAQFYSISSVLRDYVSKINHTEFIKYAFQSYQLNGKSVSILSNYLERNRVSMKSNGSIEYNNVMDTTIQKFETPKEVDEKFYSLKQFAFENIMKICNENKIQLIIVLPPTYKNVSYNSISIKKIKTLTDKNSIKLLDLSNYNSFPSIMDAKLWSDKTHFNGKGMTAFSNLLNDSLKVIVQNK